MEAKLSSALRTCDKCRTYAELCRSFEANVSPILEQALQSPLVKAPRDHTTPDECSPHVASLREALCTRLGSSKDTPAEDDVWFLIYRTVSKFMERQKRKRSRDQDGTSLSTLVTNCFVLFCTRTLPQLDHMKLRWGFLKKERAMLESSDAYVHSNSSERRKLHSM
ncbi:hypothetical protein, conserved [Leishmania tarentolae]|uniref:Uncharacterized protein n=1 Tax=Leishmania tarentolae TaxID=5689 RepID=A0A640KT20_LEITA|nr:hypothetical protein, conserved [Leishmania tarentolae]